jgi:hypothetical protein
VLWLFASGIKAYGTDSDIKPVEPVLKVYEHPNISTPPIPVIEPEIEPEPIVRTGNPEGNRSFARKKMDKWGWNDKQFECLVNLWERESNWNHEAANPKSSAYGIPQALPGKRMSDIADDWQTNPETQIKWGLKYISERYSTPCKAWKHFQNKNWY